MTPGDPISVPPSLADRVKAILLQPKEEWPRIDAEPATIGSIYTSYVVPLAAIPAVAGLIGALVFGYSFFGITYRPSIGAALGGAITQYVLALISVFVLSLIIDWLAPTFGGVKSSVQAFKVAAYSATASWVAGIFAIIPSIGTLGMLLGLYSLYLLYLGLPRLMKAPADKAMSYTIVTIIAAIVLGFVVALLVAPISSMFGGRIGPAPSEITGSINVPGLDRQAHEIRIPAGIQSGKQLRQRGAGMPVLNGRGQGDLVIQIEVETPTKLSSKQKALLEEFRATETGEECPQSHGFFAKLRDLWGS